MGKGRDCQSLVPKNLDLGKFRVKFCVPTVFRKSGFLNEGNVQDQLNLVKYCCDIPWASGHLVSIFSAFTRPEGGVDSCLLAWGRTVVDGGLGSSQRCLNSPLVRRKYPVFVEVLGGQDSWQSA